VNWTKHFIVRKLSALYSTYELTPAWKFIDAPWGGVHPRG